MNALLPVEHRSTTSDATSGGNPEAPVMLATLRGDLVYLAPVLEDAIGGRGAALQAARVDQVLNLLDLACTPAEVAAVVEETGSWKGRVPLAGGKNTVAAVEVRRLQPAMGLGCRLYRWIVDYQAPQVSESEKDLCSRLETLGFLTGGIAHDFNNIITAVLGYADIASTAKGDTEREEYLAAIRTAGLRARDLVAQILSLYKPGADKNKPFLVEKAVAETARLLRPSLPKGVSLEVLSAPGCPPILGNATKIYQVLTNLCTNACYAMEQTGGVLGMTLDCVDPHPASRIAGSAKRAVRLRVSDSGCGMPPGLVDRIFEPGFSTRRPGKGTGLGLSNVKRIVAEHHGEIAVSTEPGQGTTFTLVFPALEAKPEPVTESRCAPLPEGGGRHVLLADGDATVREIVCQTLAHSDFDVTLSGSAREALASAANAPARIDMVIADSKLPDGAGLSLIEAVRTLRPGVRTVLCVSREEVTDDGPRFASAPDALLCKPYTRDELGAAVARALA